MTEDNEKTNIRISDTAIQLFKEYGYENVTIKQICDRLGISKSSFYYHYRSKEDIISDFYMATDIKAANIVDALLTDTNTVEQLWVVMSLYFQRLLEVGVEITKIVYLSNLAGDKKHFSHEEVASRNIYLSLIKKAREEGLIKSNIKNNEALLGLIFYANTGAAYRWCITNGSFDLLKEARKIFENILGYYGEKDTQSEP